MVCGVGEFFSGELFKKFRYDVVKLFNGFLLLLIFLWVILICVSSLLSGCIFSVSFVFVIVIWVIWLVVVFVILFFVNLFISYIVIFRVVLLGMIKLLMCI